MEPVSEKALSIPAKRSAGNHIVDRETARPSAFLIPSSLKTCAPCASRRRSTSSGVATSCADESRMPFRSRACSPMPSVKRVRRPIGKSNLSRWVMTVPRPVLRGRSLLAEGRPALHVRYDGSPRTPRRVQFPPGPYPSCHRDLREYWRGSDPKSGATGPHPSVSVSPESVLLSQACHDLGLLIK